MLKQLNLLKQFGSAGKSQDATDLLSENLVLVEQRVEPARKAAQIIHKKLTGCLMSQPGLDAERRMKKLPLMSLSVSMAESLKDFDGESPIRKVLEMTCFMQSFLAKALADFEVQLEKEVLEPLNKLSEEDLPEILKNKKQFTKLTTDWQNARNRSQSSTGTQAKQDGLREDMEEAWRRLENIKDQYSADLIHFASKEEDYANYFIRLLDLQAEYHKKSLGFLERNISEVKENCSKTHSRLSSSSGKVYGAPLLSHLLDSGEEIAVPIQDCVQMLLDKGIKEEGLFRLAAAATAVKKLKNSLDSGHVDHSEFNSDPHAVAGALKSYLRELPEPLMTYDLYNEWFRAAGEKDVNDRLERLKEVLRKLPQENYNNLRYLVQFLSRLSEQQAVNRMTPSNIAIVLGPNLLWPRLEDENALMDMASASSVQVVTVIEPLIQYASSLFPEEEDFQTPESPRSPDFTESLLEGLDSWMADVHGTSLSASLSLTDSSSDSQRSPVPLQTNSGSTTCQTTSWEVRTTDSSSQNGKSMQTQSLSSTPSQELSPTESTPDRLFPSPTNVTERPQKAEGSSKHRRLQLTQWNKEEWNFELPSPTHSSSSSPPSARPMTPKTRPSAPPQDSAASRTKGKRAVVRAPGIPPPPPPHLPNKQVASAAQ